MVRPRLLGALAVMLLVVGCAHESRAPVEQKSVPSAARPRPPRVAPDSVLPAFHRVRRGDTLHAIAWRYRLDYRDLIRWNRLANPDLIVVGQKLRLRAPPGPRAKRPGPVTSPAPAVSPGAAKTPRKPKPVAKAAAPLRWQWPASGKVTRAERASGARGIEIRGRRGQKIRAASGGTVVYSGSGLRGYGELIIVKHNDTFLSAYAHNDTRLVEEGSRVKAGQEIARMGATDAREVMLHFEIRRNGKTVDPLQILPRR